MSSEAGHQRWRESIGAYVLGQLPPEERAELDDHLAQCPSCRAEVAELSPLAGLLRQLDPAELAQDVRTQDARTSRPRPWVRRGAVGLGVAASLLAAVGIGIAVRPALFPGPPVRAVAVTTTAGVQAEAGVVRHTWGTELQLRARGLSRGASYAIRFQTDAGTAVSAGSLIGTGAEPLVCSLNAAVPIEDTTHVQVTDRAGAVVIDGTLN